VSWDVAGWACRFEPGPLPYQVCSVAFLACSDPALAGLTCSASDRGKPLTLARSGTNLARSLLLLRHPRGQADRPARRPHIAKLIVAPPGLGVNCGSLTIYWYGADVLGCRGVLRKRPNRLASP